MTEPNTNVDQSTKVTSGGRWTLFLLVFAHVHTKINVSLAAPVNKIKAGIESQQQTDELVHWLAFCTTALWRTIQRT